jgi:hypothetical protein
METLVRTISDLLAAIFARFGYVGRARRRSNIKEDIGLLEQLRASPDFGPDSTAHRYLCEHIVSEVAHFSGVELRRKKIIPWASVVLAFLIGLPLAYWTYAIVKDGFDWYALLPGIVAGLMLIAATGLIVQGEAQDKADAEE